MARKYFTLLVRDGAGRPWGIHFGDFDRETVEDERRDGRDYYAARDMKIITTGSRQAAINAAVTRLNGGLPNA